jgi:hypothetical protein
MPETSREFERRLEPVLRSFLHRRNIHEDVVRSWYPFRGQRPFFYSPIPDIAVGPFATHERFISTYDELQGRVQGFIDDLTHDFRHNYREYGGHFPGVPDYPFGTFQGNENARCFIAVEVESKSTTRKHKMGSIVNASALGRIGIVVGMDDHSVKVLIRILGYLKFLASVEKPTFKPDNVFIISKQQILRILNR